MAFAGRASAQDEMTPFAFDSAGKPRSGFLTESWSELQGLMTGEPPLPARAPPGSRAPSLMLPKAAVRLAVQDAVAK